MVKMISLKCPDCGANLTIEEGRKQCFCQYCGTKIMLDDGSTTYTFRNVDEARMKEAELQASIRLKELELEEKRRVEREEKKRKSIKARIKASVILGVMGALMTIIGLMCVDIPILGEGLGMLALLGFFPLLAIPFLWFDYIGENKKE